MPWFLPPQMLALFNPRDPLPYLPPPDKIRPEKGPSSYTGIASFLKEFEDPKDTPPPTVIETKEERNERKRREKAEQATYQLEQNIASWDPHNNSAATTDPYKTLFVARLNYDTSESKLRREFEEYGPISKIIMVHDKKIGRPRGYAFIEYEHGTDMKTAYKYADGKKIDGRRCLVDIERGRTISGWLPRRLGGGLGGRRIRDPGIDPGNGETPNEDRYRERDRFERPERRHSRSRSRDRRLRPRSRSRDRHRERYMRDRSRDRRRGRDRETTSDVMNDTGRDTERKRRRSRSPDRDHKRRRSRSREHNRRRGYDERDPGRKDLHDRDERSRNERMSMNIKTGAERRDNISYEGDFNNYDCPKEGYGDY